MSEPQRPSPEDVQLQAPQELVEDLRALYGREVAVPKTVDDAILGLGRRYAARRRRHIRVVRWAVGAAAVAVLGLGLWTVARHMLWPRPVVTAREDIDRDGKVDILDAFLLARRVDGKQALQREWDIDGNGVVDRSDVDQVAMAAVSLDRGAAR